MPTTEQIMSDAIAAQRSANIRANQEMQQQLAQMRSQIFEQPMPVIGDGVPSGLDSFAWRRLQLQNSPWTSEVVAAAVLDENFKSTVGAQAHQILIARGIIPPDPVEEPVSQDGSHPQTEGVTS